MATATTEKLNTKVVPQAEWLAARKKLLAKEKEFTRLRDELSRQRREMPWEKVEKQYVFDGPNGKVTLADLFDGRSQLIVYHFMFGPGWKEGCPSCSFIADNFDGMRTHLVQRDAAFAAVSRATLPEIETFKKRMGWRFPWVSSNGSDFNYDYRVSFTKDQMGDGKRPYNFGTMDFPCRRRARPQRVLQGRAGRDLSYLLDLCARTRHSADDVQLPRYDAQGARRRGHDAACHGVGSPS